MILLKTETVKKDIKLIALLALAIVILTSAFTFKNGIIGSIINYTIFGLFGTIGYVIPIVIIIYVILKFMNKMSILLNKKPYIIITCAIMMTIIQLLTCKAINFNNWFLTSYISGVEKEISGGLLGGIFAYVMNLCVGFAGSLVVLICILVVILLFLNNRVDFKPKNNKNNIAKKETIIKNFVKTTLVKKELIKTTNNKIKNNKQESINIKNQINTLETTLKSFNIEGKVANCIIGSSVTRFELQLGIGMKFNKLNSLSKDIALCLGAKGDCIISPICGTTKIAIEIPTNDRKTVYLKKLLTNDFYNKENGLYFILGQDINGEVITPNLQEMIHLLIAGSTGSGKSITLNSMLISLLNKYSPEELKILMVDMKIVELKPYENIPHLMKPIATKANEAIDLLRFLIQEMEKRYIEFSEIGVRDIEGYNKKTENKLPKIVFVIDELAELMIVSSNEVDEMIKRLVGKSRACGICLVLSTQRPSVDVITGVIKANIPSKIALTTASHIDSTVICGAVGAEKLTGKGDLLFSPMGTSNITRVQGCYISDKEVEEDIKNIIKKYKDKNIVNVSKYNDEQFLINVLKQMILEKQTSTNFIKNKFQIGYNKTNQILNEMEKRGWLSKLDGNKPREILVKDVSKIKSNGDG